MTTFHADDVEPEPAAPPLPPPVTAPAPAAPAVEVDLVDPLSIAVYSVNRMIDLIPDLQYFAYEVDVTFSAGLGHVFMKAEPKITFTWRLP